MPEFTKGEIYGGMMKGFAQAFGDALTDMPTGKAAYSGGYPFSISGDIRSLPS